MFDLTPSERRGALTFVLLLTLGAAWDLVRANHPESIPLSAPVALPRPASSPRAPTAAAEAPRIDINRAGVEELDTLPGIGPVLARRILDHRAEYGPFHRAEDLLAVRGIGPGLFERLRARVWIGAP